MASSSKPSKRKIDHDAPISPPPLRRKVKSTTTQNTVSSFFIPASQKPPEKIVWHERAPNDDVPTTLLVGKFAPGESTSSVAASKRNKVAAFDFDFTLIKTSSGKKFASDAQDWKWWHASVPGRIRRMYLEEGFTIVIISNQGGITLKPDTKMPKAHQSKTEVFKTKVSAVFNQLDIPISIYAATEKDIYRKPRTGMWTELLEDNEISPADLDLEHSVFVGDAAGRQAKQGKPKDFSCSDRNFAANVGIKFHTPEEFFLGEEPRPFTRTFEPSEYLTAASTSEVRQTYTKKNQCDLVLFCGSPGAGKSTFYWKQLEPLGYTRVNQDTLKTREKCLKVADQYLKEGKSVAIDSTNPDTDVRSKWVQLAAKHNVPIRCVLFTASTEICEHNDVVRALNDMMNPEKRTILSSLAFRGFASRYRQPHLSEGFQDITEVAFQFIGSEVEREIWTRHWT